MFTKDNIFLFKLYSSSPTKAFFATARIYDHYKRMGLSRHRIVAVTARYKFDLIHSYIIILTYFEKADWLPWGERKGWKQRPYNGRFLDPQNSFHNASSKYFTILLSEKYWTMIELVVGMIHLFWKPWKDLKLLVSWNVHYQQVMTEITMFMRNSWTTHLISGHIQDRSP